MSCTESFRRRPRIAHVTNHGYGGVEVPYGGAPDTGGQNVYVNCIVEALVELGYHVTVFARGGFPFFGGERIREGVEPWGEHARYVYVPGGGEGFIRKEDIGVALDEEVDWLEAFVAAEARELGCAPWQVYEIVDTHYWDAGVMGMRLAERWRTARALDLLERVLGGAVPAEAVAAERARGFRSPAALAFEQVLGRTLLGATDRTARPADRAAEAVSLWLRAAGRASADEGATELVRGLVDRRTAGLSPALAPVLAAELVGRQVLALADPAGLGLGSGGAETHERVAAALDAVDRHVFTPHSLSVLKEENYKESPPPVRRALKFCERRGHEECVCRSARAFAATSTEIAERLRTHMRVPTERIFYFPAGVDRRVFKPNGEAELRALHAFLSERTGLSAERIARSPVVFETSRMDATKRKDLLLAAFAKAARSREDALCLIGGGPDNEVLAALRAQREADPVLRQRAFLLGFLPDEMIPPLFDRADLFVTGSEMEGFGLSAAQAAAVGTPIVTSDLVPFALQYVPDDAIVVPAGDVDGFARAIALLLDDPADRARRGRALAARTASLDWVEQTRAFLDHLRAQGIPLRGPEGSEDN